MSIGSKIFELRVSNNLSQGDLAEKLDVSRQSVSKWETDSSVPDLDKLIKMCDVFGVSLDDLTERSSNHNVEHTENINHNLTKEVVYRMLGSVFLGMAVLTGFFCLLFGGMPEVSVLFFPLTLASLVCSIVLFLVKQRAQYWCIWTVVSQLSFLVFHTIGIGPFSFPHLFYVMGMLIGMGIFATRIFKNVYVPVGKFRSILLVLCWIIVVALYILYYKYIDTYWILSVIFHYVIFAFIACLETYTVCYVISAKRMADR